MCVKSIQIELCSTSTDLIRVNVPDIMQMNSYTSYYEANFIRDGQVLSYENMPK